MKGYLVTTAVIFGLLALAHVMRTVSEWSRIATDPGFLLEGPGIGLLAAGLCAWGISLLRSRAASR
jgi:hypothetical protein